MRLVIEDAINGIILRIPSENCNDTFVYDFGDVDGCNDPIKKSDSIVKMFYEILYHIKSNNDNDEYYIDIKIQRRKS